MKLKLLLATLFTGISLYAGSYTVDVSHSSIGFKIKHLMISNVVGNFNTFKGSYDYDEKKGMLNSLDGVVMVESIDTGIVKRDKHLRSGDFFEVSKFPDMTFKVTEVDGEDVYADLTIKDVTKNVKFEFENGGTIKDPWGNNRSAFSLEGKINRKDFGLTWNKALETGGFVVGNRVKIMIEIEGIAKK